MIETLQWVQKRILSDCYSFLLGRNISLFVCFIYIQRRKTTPSVLFFSAADQRAQHFLPPPAYKTRLCLLFSRCITIIITSFFLVHICLHQQTTDKKGTLLSFFFFLSLLSLLSRDSRWCRWLGNAIVASRTRSINKRRACALGGVTCGSSLDGYSNSSFSSKFTSNSTTRVIPNSTLGSLVLEYFTVHLLLNDLGII